MTFNYANITVLKLRIVLIILLSFLFFNKINSQTGLGIHTVVIDPGHGGKDPGAIGYKKNMEKTVVLSVSLKLGKLIKEAFPDVEVIYTREKDEFIGLAKRAKIANEIGADLFISIHCNWWKNEHACGVETYVMGLNKFEDN